MITRGLPKVAFTVKVVGLTFVAGYPDNLLRLADRCKVLDTDGEEGPAVVLRRAPDNVHDANAIEVHVPALGDEGMVGHIPATIAEWLAPALDDGAHVGCHVVSVLIAPGREENPGLSIEVTPQGEDL